MRMTLIWNFWYKIPAFIIDYALIQGDQKVSVHLKITVQKTTKKYSILNRIHSECGLCYSEHGIREHSSACQ
jgi:hypothetical protein